MRKAVSVNTINLEKPRLDHKCLESKGVSYSFSFVKGDFSPFFFFFLRFKVWVDIFKGWAVQAMTRCELSIGAHFKIQSLCLITNGGYVSILTAGLSKGNFKLLGLPLADVVLGKARLVS